MTRSVQVDWRIDLVEAHPGLFQPPAGAPEAAQGYPECGEGWRDLLERACTRLAAALAQGDTFRALQIKEKFGTLRFYWSGTLSEAAEARIEEAIDLAEARSACTCEECGEEGRLYRAGGWLMTRCATHAKGRPDEVKPDPENIHIVERIVGNRTRVVTCRRYVRETDSFVGVDPRSLGIEDRS